MTNPLLNSASLPQFSQITPDLVAPTISELLAQNRATIANVAKQSQPTWHSLPAQLEELDDTLSKAWSLVSHLNAVTNSPAWREAYNGCLAQISTYYTELGQNTDLYQSYQTLANSTEFAQLNTAQQQAVNNALRDFTLSGVALPLEQKQRFAAIEERLSAICSKFADNLLDATQAWHKPLSQEELHGIPQASQNLLAQLATQRGLTGHIVTLDAPAYLAVITYANNRQLRETLYTAYTTRASELSQDGKFDNSPLMTEILALRYEQAQLLGYDNYAQLSLVPKMASSVDVVMQFLNELAQRAKPAAQQDLAELRAFAATLGIDDLKPWDVSYASEKLKQQKHNLSQETLRAYFPAPKVIAGVFEIVQKLYGIEITAKKVDVWADDVTYYEISENGKAFASFYLDPYARANKRGGAWMSNCRSRRVLADGTTQLPIAFLTCNFAPPVGNTPALLTHDEVITLFHEFGHGLHHMLTEVEISAVGGINGVAWDAVELPSQFMEHWCWEEDALNLMTSHIDSQESLPKALLESLLAAKNFQSGLQTLRQIEFALFDLGIHGQAPLSIEGIQSQIDKVRAEVSVMPPPAFNRFQHGFSHIFAGGYAAGYYSYKWAEVLSSDAFSRFEAEGIFNRNTGLAFRQNVLAKGGSQPALELFTAFRGREPSIDALLRHSGLEKA